MKTIRTKFSEVFLKFESLLNGILAIAELALKETDEISTKEKLKNIDSLCKFLMNFVNNTLDFSLITKGNMILEHSDVNITALFEEFIKIVE